MGKPHTRSASSGSSSSTVGRFITTDTRVDPPHGASSAGEAPASSEVPPPHGPLLEIDDGEDFDPTSMETLRNQARQLSVLLRERQETLDRREAEWQGQLARHENETRAARLWFDEQQTSLIEREAGCATREQELETRFAQLCVAEEALALLRTEQEATLKSRAEELTRREIEVEELSLKTAVESAAQHGARHEVEARRTELQREIDAVRRENELLERRRCDIESILNKPSEFQVRMQAELDQREGELDRRETDLVSRELQVRQALVEAERLQAELHAERERLAAQAKHDRLELAEQRRRLEHDAAEKRLSLERQSEQLDFRRAAVKQEQAELAESQRETLEMRLAVEELWTQLSGLVPPAILTENLARLRSMLAERYRLQQNDLASQKAELETLRADLAAENEKLRIQTNELRRWAEARHEEIERQAAFLTDREQELERQECDANDRSAAWRQERGRLEQEIRRLEGELRRVGIELPSYVRTTADRRTASLR